MEDMEELACSVGGVGTLVNLRGGTQEKGFFKNLHNKRTQTRAMNKKRTPPEEEHGKIPLKA